MQGPWSHKFKRTLGERGLPFSTLAPFFGVRSCGHGAELKVGRVWNSAQSVHEEEREVGTFPLKA